MSYPYTTLSNAPANSSSFAQSHLTAPLQEARQSARRGVHLTFSSNLLSPIVRNGIKQDRLRLVSYTCDINADGLALLVPSLPFVYRYLMGKNNTLQFVVDLPTGPVEIEAAPIHDRPPSEDEKGMCYMINGQVEIEAVPPQYEFYDKDEKEKTCVVGVRIKNMSYSSRARYIEYLSSL